MNCFSKVFCPHPFFLQIWCRLCDEEHLWNLWQPKHRAGDLHLLTFHDCPSYVFLGDQQRDTLGVFDGNEWIRWEQQKISISTDASCWSPSKSWLKNIRNHCGKRLSSSTPKKSLIHALIWITFRKTFVMFMIRVSSIITARGAHHERQMACLRLICQKDSVFICHSTFPLDLRTYFFQILTQVPWIPWFSCL